MTVGTKADDDGSGASGSFTIVNKRGLHARASARLVRLVESFDVRVTVAKDGMTVGGTSIMGLMLLVASLGSTVDIRAEGPDARAAIDAIGALIDDKFGEGE